MYYTSEQEAAILKGIASQILYLDMPSIKVLKKLLDSFDIQLDAVEKHIILTSNPINDNINWIKFPVKWSPNISSPVDIYYALRSDCTEAIELAEKMAMKYASQNGYHYNRNDRLVTNFGYTVRCYECSDHYWAVIRDPYWLI